MKVLVTGAAGFIGSHLIDRLLRNGYTVVGLDRFRLGVFEHYKVNASYRDRLRLISADITDPRQVSSEYFDGVDWVFHLGARIGNAVSRLSPSEYHAVNVDGTVHVLSAAQNASVKKFIYVSTASVYGNPDTYPTDEETDIKLDYPYAVSKYIGENYCLHWWKVYRLPVIIFRLFNVYGPKNRKNGTYGPTLSIFLDQKKQRKPLTIRGDGTQRRDFTYIDDIYDVFVASAKSSIIGEIFNIGNGKAYSMNELAHLIGGPITYIPFTEKEPQLTLADIRKIVKYTGWKPKVSLPEGISRVLKEANL